MRNRTLLHSFKVPAHKTLIMAKGERAASWWEGSADRAAVTWTERTPAVTGQVAMVRQRKTDRQTDSVAPVTPATDRTPDSAPAETSGKPDRGTLCRTASLWSLGMTRARKARKNELIRLTGTKGTSQEHTVCDSMSFCWAGEHLWDDLHNLNGNGQLDDGNVSMFTFWFRKLHCGYIRHILFVGRRC